MCLSMVKLKLPPPSTWVLMATCAICTNRNWKFQATSDEAWQFFIGRNIAFFSLLFILPKNMTVWMRLKTNKNPVYFCFFYAPGSHHPLDVRKKYYDEFSLAFSKYAPHGKVYLMGDTNARLGSLIDDRNVHGQLTSNPNKPLFLEFLEYSGLVILNKLYCKGIPTYEIVNQKRSIIDLCLTNSPESVCNFEIESKPFGVSSQTCHKALTTTILLKFSERHPISLPRRNSFGKLTGKKRRKITLDVANKI